MHKILIAGQNEAVNMNSEEYAEASFVAKYDPNGKDVHICKNRDGRHHETISSDLLLVLLGENIHNFSSRS